jgi:hypothetical protein
MSNLIKPTRSIREVDGFTQKYNYYDWETVTQEDGRIAKFMMQNHHKDKGWEFVCYIDKFGFELWDGTESEEITQTFLTGVQPYKPHQVSEELGVDFCLSCDEQLFRYKYGGVLSSRGGWFVTSIHNPMKILRSKQIWMS